MTSVLLGALLAVGLVTGATPDPVVRDVYELRIELGGLTIRALCTDGARHVVLWHGDGSSAETWRPVLERLDGSVGACAFDRRGSGESVPAPDPRGWYELVDELRRIHLALGFERDYVLVAHALGGLYARAYAVDRPTDLAGLLLVDPAHEDMPDRLRTGMPRDVWEAWTSAQAEPNRDGVTERSVGRRARRSRLPDIPVTVISAALRQDGDGWDARFVNEGTRQLHAAILRGVTSGRHIPAERSGHDVQQDQPSLVADEIRRVLRSAKR